MIELGGNIELIGFKELDKGTFTIIKKMVGLFVKKISSQINSFQKLSITLKKVHETENSAIYNFMAKLSADKIYNAESEGRNIFVEFDNVLKKLENSIKK